ncbi:MAG: choice-of-anchor D domain-containing protein, partial [Haliscomenobacteraceae bacterium CHB4]|nr:choice-of-anchor D domain-containing protein [Haliscomenobacteraceae bacterium CHB4]
MNQRVLAPSKVFTSQNICFQNVMPQLRNRCFPAVLRFLFAVTALFGMSQTSAPAQVTIASQGFETSGGTWGILTGSSHISTDAGAGDSPSSQRIRGGTHSWQVNDETAVLQLIPVNVTGYTSVKVKVRISSTSASGSNGADSGDNLTVETSLDGASFTDDIDVAGNSNSRWSYNNAENAVTTAGTLMSVAGTPGTNQGTIFSTLVVDIPNGTTSVGLRITADNDNADEFWNVDDVEIIGTVSPAEMNVLGNNTSIADGDATPSPADYTDFGNVGVGIGYSRSFTIKNLGTTDLNLTGSPKVVVGGANAADFVVTTAPVSPVEGVGGATTFTVTFTPGAAGLRSATLSIANDDSDENPYNFSIQGTGVNAPEMEVRGDGMTIADGDATPSTLDGSDFGITSTTSGTVTHTFTIHNFGNADLNLTGTPKVVVGGANAADFTVTMQPTTPVSAGGSVTFTVDFNPSADGLRTAILSIDNDDSDENPYNFSIQGEGSFDINDCGNSCSAGDVNVTAVIIGDINGVPVPLNSCANQGSTIEARLIFVIENGAGTDRYAFRVGADVWIDGMDSGMDIIYCHPTSVPGNSTVVIVDGDFMFTYGQTVELKNLTIAWRTQNMATCANSQDCNDYPNGQCRQFTTYTVTSPLSVDFSSACGTPAPLTAVFTDETIGGTAPYTYSWDFGDPGSGANNTSALQNPTHTFSAPGTYTVSLTVTDADGVSCTHVEDFNTNDCCQDATADAGAGQPVCVNDDVFLSGMITGGSTTGTWDDGGAGGTFSPNANDLNATYTPPLNFTGTITITLTPDAPAAPCVAIPDDLTLTVAPNPTLTVTAVAPAGATCGDMISIDFEVSSSFTDISSLQFSVEWDETMLMYVSPATALQIGGAGGDPVIGDGDALTLGELTYTWFDPSGFDGEDLGDGTTILTLMMKVLGSTGTATVSITDNPAIREIVDANFCSNTVTPANADIALSPITVNCPADFAVCVDAAPFALTGATPPGGTYSGTGV